MVKKTLLLSESFQAYRLWSRIVITFSCGALTVKQDKLPALAGIVQKMAGLLDDQYLAGLWRRFIVDELCWSATVQNRGEPQKQPFRLTTYCAPSWSWTSEEGQTTPDDYGYGYPLIEVLDAQVEPASDNPFGSVKSGPLLLQGVFSTFEITGDLSEIAHGWSSKLNRRARGKNEIEIMLDDAEDRLQEGLYCLPVKFLPDDDASGYGPWLQGLILQRTGPAQECYRHIGAFFLPDDVKAVRACHPQREDKPATAQESKAHETSTVRII